MAQKTHKGAIYTENRRNITKKNKNGENDIVQQRHKE